MPDVVVYTSEGAAGSPITLRDDVFGADVHRSTVYQAVLRQLADARQGTHDTKTRGEVAGSTRKMWRQKGTGRARQGAKRAPHWRHGGVVFGPHPRSYAKAMPKKMRRLALRSALSAKAQAGELVVVERFAIDTPSTKAFLRLITALAPEGTALVVLDTPQPAVQLSARNLPHVTTATVDNLNVFDVLRHNRLVVTTAAARAIEQRFGPPAADLEGPNGDEDESEAPAGAGAATVATADTGATGAPAEE